MPAIPKYVAFVTKSTLLIEIYLFLHRMRIVIALSVILLVVRSFKNNYQKVIKEWRLLNYTGFDRARDNKIAGLNYSEKCPYMVLEIKENVCNNYVESYDGVQQNYSEGIYVVSKDNMIIEGFDQNQVWFRKWYLINKLNRSRFDFSLWQVFYATIGDWELAAVVNYDYRLKK